MTNMQAHTRSRSVPCKLAFLVCACRLLRQVREVALPSWVPPEGMPRPRMDAMQLRQERAQQLVHDGLQPVQGSTSQFLVMKSHETLGGMLKLAQLAGTHPHATPLSQFVQALAPNQLCYTTDVEAGTCSCSDCYCRHGHASTCSPPCTWWAWHGYLRRCTATPSSGWTRPWCRLPQWLPCRRLQQRHSLSLSLSRAKLLCRGPRRRTMHRPPEGLGQHSGTPCPWRCHWTRAPPQQQAGAGRDH